jgi:hypothetical protein
MDGQVDYSIWQDFAWIPTPLLEQWFHVVNDSTKPAKWEVMHRVVRRDNVVAFFQVHEGTLNALHYALEGCRVGTSQYYCAHLIAVLMALETLATNFLLWADSNQTAKAKAEELCDQYFSEKRLEILGFFFPISARAYLRKEMQRSFGPQPSEYMDSN